LSRLILTLVAAAGAAVATTLARPQAHPQRATPAADVSAAPRRPAPQRPAQQAAASQAPERWSAPANLSDCPATPGARVVFPSDKPTQSTGPGAIAWADSPACPGGEGARTAAIGAGDRPGAATAPKTANGHAIVLRGPLVAAGAPHGQIAIAGAAAGGPHATPASGVLIQGAADGPFSALATLGGTLAPRALATAYLGDLALASPPAGAQGGDALNVHVERFFSDRFVRNVSVRSAGHGPVEALTLAMDFRSEALAVWVQRGAIYARLVPNEGAPRPIQRLASVAPHVHLSALLSDDRRGIVAWAEENAGVTSVYIDRSGVGVRFAEPQLLERFSDPDGLDSPTASPSLVRLSSESVLLAWAGAAEGHWVVRAAPVDLKGVLTLATIAAPGADALLAGMAPGPDEDALLLWTEPAPSESGAPDLARQALLAARGIEAGSGRVAFDEPETISAPGPVVDPTVAMDPDDDAALAVWQGEAGAIEYSVRSPSAAP
jgi:hypothetical protein